jgi:hypothetical protein
MSLYEYNLYLVREAARGEILPAVERPGLVVRTGEEEGVAGAEIHCYVDEWPLAGGDSAAVRVLRLMLDPDAVEQELHDAPSAFVDWLWDVLAAADAAYAFMGEGGYAEYFTQGRMTIQDVLGQMGALVEHGEVRYVHPLMFFAERLADGALCEVAATAPGYRVTRRAGAGCLLLLTSVNAESGSMEILDPGTAYGRLSRHFRPRNT